MTTAEVVLPCLPVSAVSSPWAARDWAIAHHFDGHADMYDSIRAASLMQFRSDIVNGDAACSHLDRAALCRLAHSLKGVLLLLGATVAARHARSLEVAAAGELAEAGADADTDVDADVDGPATHARPAEIGAVATHALPPLWHALRSAVLALAPG